ncbi:hypothetical protein PRZ48_008220 [Zasmidium cellare]|uniref:Uncharacterized protein n=1 Tax=Zasmidium cellare TaxID=395010 RepID=A0ABR0EEU9_ZASCE|nr:hypothetical protein PRZ48_008220 [Zasmidium cellare]
MDEHHHKARSKGAVPVASTGDDSSSQPTHPSSSSSATSIQPLDKVNPGVQNPIETPADDTNTETTVPKLFLLPDEIQTIIYEFAVIEPGPVDVRIWPAKRESKRKQWRITTSVNGSGFPDARPSVLAVCKYLRSFVAPIYFSSNTFLIRTAQHAGMLRRKWGDDVKHIRRLECVVAVNIVTRHVHHGRPGGRLDRAEIKTDMKILADGSLFMERYTWICSLPMIQLCYCRLETVAASSSAVGKDSRRMFDVIAQCALDHENIVEVKTCNYCNKQSMTAECRNLRRQARAIRRRQRLAAALALVRENQE